MQRFHNKKAAGFTLIEIMIVVLIIGILLAIAIPNFVQARESARTKSCIGNLKQIDSAKQQCAMDNKLAASSTATFKIDGTATSGSAYGLVDTTGATGYLRTIPACPSGGTYNTQNVTTTPTCTTGSAGTGAYAAGGQYYHGLS